VPKKPLPATVSTLEMEERGDDVEGMDRWEAVAVRRDNDDYDDDKTPDGQEAPCQQDMALALVARKGSGGSREDDSLRVCFL
jgi:hypothetical protein